MAWQPRAAPASPAAPRARARGRRSSARRPSCRPTTASWWRPATTTARLATPTTECRGRPCSWCVPRLQLPHAVEARALSVRCAGCATQRRATALPNLPRAAGGGQDHQVRPRVLLPMHPPLPHAGREEVGLLADNMPCSTGGARVCGVCAACVQLEALSVVFRVGVPPRTQVVGGRYPPPLCGGREHSAAVAPAQQGSRAYGCVLHAARASLRVCAELDYAGDERGEGARC